MKTKQKSAPKCVIWETHRNSISLGSLRDVHHPFRSESHCLLLFSSQREKQKRGSLHCVTASWVFRWWVFAPPHNFVVAPGEDEPGRKDKGKAGYKNKWPAFCYVPFSSLKCSLQTSCVGPLMAASRLSKLSMLRHRWRAERGCSGSHSNFLGSECLWVVHGWSLFPREQIDFSTSHKTAQQRFLGRKMLYIF